MDEETCCRYDNIKMLLAFLKRIKGNSNKMMKTDTGAIENQLFTVEIEDCGTVRSYYGEIRTLSKDLE